ncbi:MAG TPA: hypothetical protein VMT03_16370 [Polyangia bacterium]|nr:hypothetical protein [Polyangia bacterium]
MTKIPFALLATTFITGQALAAPAASLKGVCPDKIVIQTDWFSTPERAAAYQLAGPNGTIDKKKGTYSGPLGTTGVSVEVRLGGPFIGFQPIPALMYQNPEILLGYVATDDAVQAAAKFPTKAVVAPLDINPQVLIWDPASFTVAGWPDIAKTRAKVLYLEGLPFMDFLISKGFVTKDQLDASFDGTPSRFVAERGKIIQQGYASNEPYRWEHDVAGWKKPVKYLLVHDSGYQIYPQGLAVRASQLAPQKACLKALVPIIQQAQVDYMTNPRPTNEALVRIGKELAGGPPITASANAAAVVTMKKLGLVGNGPDKTLGNFDLARVEKTIAQLKAIFAARGVKVPAALTAGDIVTNEFIDPSIHL